MTKPAQRDDPLSPELVLVDPELAVRARLLLSEPADTSARRAQPEPKTRPTPSVASFAAARRLAAPLGEPVETRPIQAPPEAPVTPSPAAVAAARRLAAPLGEPVETRPIQAPPEAPVTPSPAAVAAARRLAAPLSEPAETRPVQAPPEAPLSPAVAAARRLDELAAQASESGPTGSRRLRRMLAAVAVTFAGLALALLLADLQRGPAPESVAVEAAAPTEGVAGRAVVHRDGRLVHGRHVERAGRSGGLRRSSCQDRKPPSNTVTSPGPRRFAWAPAENASGYHLELFRNGARIFARDTTRPELTIPAAWTFGGKQYRLEPVEYRWYVWPIVSGRRVAEAVVRARLIVRDR